MLTRDRARGIRIVLTSLKAWRVVWFAYPLLNIGEAASRRPHPMAAATPIIVHGAIVVGNVGRRRTNRLSPLVVEGRRAHALQIGIGNSERRQRRAGRVHRGGRGSRIVRACVCFH